MIPTEKVKGWWEWEWEWEWRMDYYDSFYSFDKLERSGDRKARTFNNAVTETISNSAGTRKGSRGSVVWYIADPIAGSRCGIADPMGELLEPKLLREKMLRLSVARYRVGQCLTNLYIQLIPNSWYQTDSNICGPEYRVSLTSSIATPYEDTYPRCYYIDRDGMSHNKLDQDYGMIAWKCA